MILIKVAQVVYLAVRTLRVFRLSAYALQGVAGF